MGILPIDLFGSWAWTNVCLAFLVIFFVYYIYPWWDTSFPNLSGPFCLPVIGNILQAFSKGIGPFDIENLKKYGPVYIIRAARTEELTISDPTMIKHILVKDFPMFTNRRMMYMRGIFKKGLLDARDENWRSLRHLLTPAFTTRRLKNMMPLVERCTERLVHNLQSYAESKERINLKELNAAFAMEVIGSTAFGVDLDSQSDPNNPFLVNAKKIFDVSVKTLWLFMATLFIPILGPIFERMGIVAGSADVFKFYENFIQKAIEERRADKTPRSDFLQMMLDIEHLEMDSESKKNLEGIAEIPMTEKRKLTSEEILAQCLLFFFAAYDTTSSALAFFLYSMAENPEIQEKVYREIQDVMTECKDVSYEALSSLTYTEQCINETLRMYPALMRIDRTTGRDIDIEGLHIPAGTVVNIPVYALHYDEKVWPEPEKFDPERFSPEARSSRDNFHFLPFGIGPRMCIGMRLAMMEIKMALVKVISKYRFKPAGVTLDLELIFLLRAKGGVWAIPEMRHP